jgi:hypothetical protein
VSSAWVIVPVFGANKAPLWQVGHYGPNGNFVPISDDHEQLSDAEAHVHYLNGGITDDDMGALLRLVEVMNAHLRNIR